MYIDIDTDNMRQEEGGREMWRYVEKHRYRQIQRCSGLPLGKEWYKEINNLVRGSTISIYGQNKKNGKLNRTIL